LLWWPAYVMTNQGMAPLDRNEKFQLRLTKQEREWLEKLAEHEGLSASDVIRRLIRAAHIDLAESAFPRIMAPIKPPPTVVKRPKAKTKK
jgi:hypothetical protein